MKQQQLPLFTIVVFSIFIVTGRAAFCTGNPPKFNGLPCATTTRYWDGQKGACGCGTTDQSPYSWQWTSHTAAGSQALFDVSGSTWCGAGCGSCYELIPSGDCLYGGSCATNTAPITVMITNRCPYQGNEQWCPNPGNANQYGYEAHFDLMDYNMNGWVDSLGWNNPIVTYRRVPCGSGGSPTCSQASTCQCTMLDNCQSGGNATTSSSATTSSASSGTPSSPTSSSSGPTSSSSSGSGSVSSSTGAASSGTGSSGSSSSSSGGGSSSGTSSSSGSTSGSGNTVACGATITATVASTWEGGGLVNINIRNTGTHPITLLTLKMNATPGVSSWNIQQQGGTNNLWSLMNWAYPIPPGSVFSSIGFTYTTTNPAVSISSVSC